MVKIMSDIKIYTLDEVANILKVTRRTLYHYIKSGSLSAIRIGKYWRVSEDSLKAFLNKAASSGV